MTRRARGRQRRAIRADAKNARSREDVVRLPEWLWVESRRARRGTSVLSSCGSQPGTWMSSAGQALPKNIFDLLEDVLVLFLGIVARAARTFPSAALWPSCSSSGRCSLVSFFGVTACTVKNRSPRPRPDTSGIPLPAKAEDGARLRAFGHLERFVSVERRHVDGAAERERREVQRNFARQVVALAPEERVRRHFDEDVKIARRPAVRTAFAFAADAQPLAVGDARGNLDRELAFLLACVLRPCTSAHGFEMTRPDPWQREHVRATVKNPCWNRCWPRPWHCGHVVGLAARRGARTAARVARLETGNLDRRSRRLSPTPRT